jgi:membrane protein YqaA with SNARE-associated domain
MNGIPVLRRLYDWILLRAGGQYAERWFAAICFIDGALLPLPPELLQIPMAISRPQRTMHACAIGIVSSATGAMVGYAIGALFYAQLAVPLLRLTGHLDKFNGFLHSVGENWLLWPIAFFAMPQVAAMAAGTVPLGIAGAVAGSLVGRGTRFVIVALLLRHFGAAAQHWVEHHFHRAVLAVAGLVAAFVIVRYAL